MCISTSRIRIFLLFLFLSFQFSASAFQKKQFDEQEYPPKNSVIEDSIPSTRNPLEKYSEAYYNVSQLNDGIGFPPAQYNLTTPQATLDHFIVKSRNKDFKAAAYALNLNLLPDNISIPDAAILPE